MGAAIFSAFSPSDKYRADAYDITAYIGKNGTGKTMFAVNDLLPTLSGVKWECFDESHYHTQIGLTSGYRNVLSTVQLLNPSTKKPHGLCVPYLAHDLILVAEHSDILLDEITAIYPSRGFGGLPNDVAIILNQMRKPDLKVKWTAPNWARADVILREVTEQVVSIRRFAPKAMPGRVRKTFSRFLIRSFNGDDFKNWINNNMKLKIKPESYEFYYRRDDLKKGYQAQHYYNTFGAAYVPATDAQGGTCLHCGGRRTADKCSCTPETLKSDLILAAKKFWSNQMSLDEDELPTLFEVEVLK